MLHKDHTCNSRNDTLENAVVIHIRNHRDKNRVINTSTREYRRWHALNTLNMRYIHMESLGDGWERWVEGAHVMGWNRK